MIKRALLLLILLTPTLLAAQIQQHAPAPPTALDAALTSPNPQEAQDFLNLHSQLRIMGLLTALGLIPFVVIMMTSFTRIMIVMSFLRQALGTQQVPSNQLTVGLSLILTGFVMQPVIVDIQENAISPYMNNEFKNHPDVRMGVKGEDSLLMEKAWGPLRGFLLQHTREKDLMLFLEMGKIELPKYDQVDLAAANPDGTGSAYNLDAIPWFCLVPGFVLSELRIAFMMGFLLFLPFLVIDMVIASVLMSMGMMMLPPVMISMPFKLLLFILVDGWRLVISQIVNGYYPAG